MHGIQAQTTQPSWLAPREHGAYGQLLAPMLAAIFAGHFSWAGIAYGLAGTCAFYAHEPWLVMIGQRGTRAQRQQLKLAKRQLWWLVTCALLLAAIALLLSDRNARVFALLLALLGSSAAAMSRSELIHTSFGEVWAGVVLSCLGVPIALAAGVSFSTAVAMWIAWSLAFASGVFAVRGLIDRRKIGSRGPAPWGLLIACLGLGIEATWCAPMVLAVIPFTLTCGGVLLWAPTPRLLRTIGWTLVGLTVLAAILMVFAARMTRFS